MQRINGSVTSIFKKFKSDEGSSVNSKVGYYYNMSNFFELGYWEQATEEECIESFNKLITKPRLCKK